MPHFCLLVADASRARIYTAEPSDPEQPLGAVTLVERADLINSERRHPPAEVASHSFTDHRPRHTEEVDRRFARELSSTLTTISRDCGTGSVVAIASPHMLGLLRPAIQAVTTMPLHSIALDLTRLTTPQIHDRLAELQLVPARERLTA